MQTLNGILSCVGNTPIVALEKYFDNAPFQLFAKMEMFNPGGSIKDRPAVKMLMSAYEAGLINDNSTIIESSSGNLGIGLAQACAILDLKFICVTDIRSTVTARRMIKAYGATIDFIERPHPERGYLGARLDRVQALLEATPNSFNCDQYKNLNNPHAHYTTIKEIFDALENNVDYIFCSTSTCGTLRGFSEYVAKQKLDTKIIGIDAVGSVIFGDTPKKRLIPGHGSAVVPPHYKSGLEYKHVLVDDLACVTGCRRLIRREGVFAGGSSGAIISGIEKMQNEIEPGSTVVGILCDSGVRYLDTIYSDEWVSSNFGEVAHLWEPQEVI